MVRCGCAHGKNFTAEIAEDTEREVVLWEGVVWVGDFVGFFCFGCVWVAVGVRGFVARRVWHGLTAFVTGSFLGFIPRRFALLTVGLGVV